jgi:hypothetical protein
MVDSPVATGLGYSLTGSLMHNSLGPISSTLSDLTGSIPGGGGLDDLLDAGARRDFSSASASASQQSQSQSQPQSHRHKGPGFSLPSVSKRAGNRDRRSSLQSMQSTDSQPSVLAGEGSRDSRTSMGAVIGPLHAHRLGGGLDDSSSLSGRGGSNLSAVDLADAQARVAAAAGGSNGSGGKGPSTRSAAAAASTASATGAAAIRTLSNSSYTYPGATQLSGTGTGFMGGRRGSAQSTQSEQGLSAALVQRSAIEVAMAGGGNGGNSTTSLTANYSLDLAGGLGTMGMGMGMGMLGGPLPSTTLPNLRSLASTSFNGGIGLSLPADLLASPSVSANGAVNNKYPTRR